MKYIFQERIDNTYQSFIEIVWHKIDDALIHFYA